MKILKVVELNGFYCTLKSSVLRCRPSERGAEGGPATMTTAQYIPCVYRIAYGLWRMLA